MGGRTFPRTVRKRDGSLVGFDPSRIHGAIERALRASGTSGEPGPRVLTADVVGWLQSRTDAVPPGVEDIQNLVEEALIRRGMTAAAKAYILYRHSRASVRDAKSLFGVRDNLKLSLNAVRVLQRRYLLRDDQGHVVETPMQMFERVAGAVAEAERQWGGPGAEREWRERFLQAMSTLEFLPNSPTLMNAGTKLGQLSACFVLPVEDSIDGIFGAVQKMARIHQTGGGTGFSFSRLRPRGDIVGSTRGVASGPVSFMSVFDCATDVVKQGGKRRGANMGILHVGHPDILEFIDAKTREGALRNFNLSVAVTDAFMRAVEADEDYPLINPRTGGEVARMSARGVFDLCVVRAWETGDPGLIFIDEVNRANPTPDLGEIQATNPCGELPLLPYESCNLGSVNLARLIRNSEIDWKRLGEVVRLGVRFLDDVIDRNRYVCPEIERITRANRKIGLGVMGFADLLISLGVPYDSEEALRIGERIMQAVSDEGRRASVQLAEERGVFPNWENSVFKGRNLRVRNATVTTVAPTGTISIIAGCSSGIEPIFAVAYVRTALEGARMLEMHPAFERLAKERGFHSPALMMAIARRGSVRGLREVPDDVARVFATAMDVSTDYHVGMQAVFQKHCDNSVSKTVNIPAATPPDTVRRVYVKAWQLGCKGVTVYRYGTRSGQVLALPEAERHGPLDLREPATAGAEYAGGCPSRQCMF